MRTLPETLGALVLTGPRATTMSVGAVVAVPSPATLCAVTRTRRVCPTSSAVAVWVIPFAPSMSTQSSPAVSQRRHWKSRVIGAVPVQVPSTIVSVEPSRASPPIDAGTELTGGVDCGSAAAIAPVGSEVRDAVPPGPVAVTATRSVLPSSAAVGA